MFNFKLRDNNDAIILKSNAINYFFHPFQFIFRFELYLIFACNLKKKTRMAYWSFDIKGETL